MIAAFKWFVAGAGLTGAAGGVYSAFCQPRYGAHRAAAAVSWALTEGVGTAALITTAPIIIAAAPFFVAASVIETVFDVPTGPSESTTISMYIKNGEVPMWNITRQWDDGRDPNVPAVAVT